MIAQPPANWIECEISDGMSDLHISHAPDADLDGEFQAFDLDYRNTITIRGWLITSYEIVTE